MFFKIVLCLTAICVCASSTKRPILIDLSYTLSENTLVYPTLPKFKFKHRYSSDTPFYVAANTLEMSEHTSTHVDAMVHFIKNGSTVSDMKLNDFFLNAIVIDLSKKCEVDPNYAVTVDDLKFTKIELAFMKRHRNLLLIRTGFGKYWGNSEKYLGLNETTALSDRKFPGIGIEAANKLVEMKVFTAVGLDSVSLDTGNSHIPEAHRILLGAGIYGFENVARLDLVPTHEFFTVYAFPMNIEEGTGAPIRLIAEFKAQKNAKSPFKFRSKV